MHTTTFAPSGWASLLQRLAAAFLPDAPTRSAPEPRLAAASAPSAPSARHLRSERRGVLAGDRHALGGGFTRSDAWIRGRLLYEFDSEPGWQSQRSNVHVQDGVVVLQGLVRSEADKRELGAVVARVPGVRKLRDERVRAREWQSMV